MNEGIRLAILVISVACFVALIKHAPVPKPEPVETYDECVERLMQEYCDVLDTDALVGFRISCSPVPEDKQCPLP